MLETLVPLLALLIPIYWMWRTHIAANARVKLMKEVDAFLNPEKQNSEMTKDMVYNAYEDSKNHFLILEMLHFAFFKIDAESFTARREEFKQIDTAERKKMAEIVTKLMLTNIKLSPITYFVVGVVFLFIVLLVTLANHLSPKKIKQNLQTLKEKTLYSIYCF
ncbi:hypothetical protein [Thiomicrorhabdus lithotrophica]|uniref:Uncharacterized protein n=1 Tax=Thiomicrorhabdus lithotrophica TaxID=2949997 RepID=A0ABY8CDH0_9GAMM|nr:hypothetical protein [Thiomicrorhabdus lithotrophica]WEJ62178.1 hypothetical protein NR989_09170 [Thiomicrorhabdus lithotrophica]